MIDASIRKALKLLRDPEISATRLLTELWTSTVDATQKKEEEKAKERERALASRDNRPESSSKKPKRETQNQSLDGIESSGSTFLSSKPSTVVSGPPKKFGFGAKQVAPKQNSSTLQKDSIIEAKVGPTHIKNVSMEPDVRQRIASSSVDDITASSKKTSPKTDSQLEPTVIVVKDGSTGKSPISEDTARRPKQSEPNKGESDAQLGAGLKSWLQPGARVAVDYSGDWYDAVITKCVPGVKVEVRYTRDDSIEEIKGTKIAQRIRSRNSLRKRSFAEDPKDVVKNTIRPPGMAKARAIEQIIDRSEAVNGVKYLVKWKGKPESENSWEREEDVPKEFIDSFVVVGADDDDDEYIDYICKICKDYRSEEPNLMVICDGCMKGYHQICHDPKITDEIVNGEDEWYCSEAECQHKKKLNRASEDSGLLVAGDDLWKDEEVDQRASSADTNVSKPISSLASQKNHAGKRTPAEIAILKKLSEAERQRAERQKRRPAANSRLGQMKLAMKKGTKTHSRVKKMKRTNFH